jgi:5-methyltetrahydropteroyltriglutamate--homocysteine methyltransferase
MPENKMVILGLISSKDPALESPGYLLARIEEASVHVPLGNLALSPQCGFASTAAGNLLTEEQQWRKLELVAEINRRVWGD